MDKSNDFVICIHDVCPQTSSQVLRILDNLNKIVGSKLSVAVIPLPDKISWRSEDHTFVEELKDRTKEILLHGLIHKRTYNKSLISFFIENSDELSGMTTCEIDALLKNGQKIFYEHFGNIAKGFVPPGWRMGEISESLLGKHGIDYIISLSYMKDAMKNKLSLASWSWDCGRVPFTGYLGEFAGTVLFILKKSVPCVVLHPKDLERGFIPRSTRLIRQFLDKGYRPITYDKLYQNIRREH